MPINVENFHDQTIARESELLREVASAVHDALGLPDHPDVSELQSQIMDLGARTIGHLSITESTEAVRAMLSCCFLRQFRTQLHRYDERVTPLTHNDYFYVMSNASGEFMERIRQGYVINVKRCDGLTNGRINRAVVQVNGNEFNIVYL